MPSKSRLYLALGVFSVIMLASVVPSSYASTGFWRLLSPTEYTGTPDASVRGVFAIDGGTGGINSGNVWAVGDAGLIFHWDGFSWRIYGPSPTPCQLNSVSFGGPLIPSGSNFAGVSTSVGWIVGGSPGCAGATALYYDGTGWSTQTSGLVGATTLKSVYTVTGSSSVEAWAVGVGPGVGDFWHWFGAPGGGGSWSDVSAGVATGPVNGVYMTHGFNLGSADEGWAVGDGGKVYHWFGGGWNVFQTVNLSGCGTTPDLESVALDSTTDGWAVGTCGSIYHYTGGTWNGPVSPGTTSNDLLSIVMLSSDEAWAVGKADPGTSNPTILHGSSLTGTPSWTRIALEKLPRAGNMYGVTFGVSGNNIWGVGAGGLFALCGSGCGDSTFWGATSSPLVTDLNGAYLTGDNDGWVVGKAMASPSAPTILHWDGVTLTRGSATAGANDLYAVWMTGSSDGWAVGGNGGVSPTATVHYSGGTWTDVASAACVNPGCILRGIYMSGSSSGWAVGAKGQIDTFIPSPAGHWGLGSNLADPTLDLYSVYCDPGNFNSCWAVGGNGGGNPAKIIHTTNGGVDGWAPAVSSPGGVALGTILHSIFMTDNTHIWVVGDQSTILFSGNNGATWTAYLIAGVANSPLTLTGVYLDSNTDGWATGVDNLGFPVLVHYDGTGWSQEPLFSNLIANKATLNGLFLTSSTNGLAVGTQVTGVPTSLGLAFHLDPPGLYGGGGTSATTSTTAVTSTSVVTSTNVVMTTSASSSTSQGTASSTQTASSQVTSTSEASTTIVVTTTPESTESGSTSVIMTSSMTTPLVMPAVPGFPVESIIVGLMLGLTGLAIIRRRRKSPSP